MSLIASSSVPVGDNYYQLKPIQHELLTRVLTVC